MIDLQSRIFVSVRLECPGVKQLMELTSENSSYVARRSSSRASATSFRLPLFVDTTDLPDVGSLSILTRVI